MIKEVCIIGWSYTHGVKNRNKSYIDSEISVTIDLTSTHYERWVRAYYDDKLTKRILGG